MVRTGHRPWSPARSVRAGRWYSASTLAVLAVGWFAVTTNLLSAALAATAVVFYVVGYTLLLKRRTAQNIVWGGAAGCMPVLIGWTAVTGSLAWEPCVLFAVVFCWTPPHYWPLSCGSRTITRPPASRCCRSSPTPTRRRGTDRLYSWGMVLASLLLTPVAGMNWLYTATAVVLGVLWMREAYVLRGKVRSGAEQSGAMRLFHGSISYLSLLFLAVAIDPFLG